MENKQTAIEWLEQKMLSDTIFNWKVVFEKAKQMEKEQSRKDYYGGVRDEMQNIGSDFEDYYKETYGEIE